jgi:tetraacyldisaccharide 4'-kinase
VISVGSLTVGGAGKTPLVAHLARLLIETGERPAILSRGYARVGPRDGVVTVRDPERLCASLDESGDEPLMLARQLPGCAVLVAEDRHLAGAIAESRLGCTVHLLDDGFQHVALARDLDLLLVRCEDLAGEPVLPAGRLRESASAAAVADAWIGEETELAALTTEAARVGVRRVFAAVRTLGRPQNVSSGDPTSRPVVREDRLLLVSGLACPTRFEAEVRAGGSTVVEHLIFADHHPYTRRDVDAIDEKVRAAGATQVLTSEKDAVRLQAVQPWPFSLATVSLSVRIEPHAAFSAWLQGELSSVRRANGAGDAGHETGVAAAMVGRGHQ